MCFHFKNRKTMNISIMGPRGSGKSNIMKLLGAKSRNPDEYEVPLKQYNLRIENTKFNVFNIGCPCQLGEKGIIFIEDTSADIFVVDISTLNGVINGLYCFEKTWKDQNVQGTLFILFLHK